MAWAKADLLPFGLSCRRQSTDHVLISITADVAGRWLLAQSTTLWDFTRSKAFLFSSHLLIRLSTATLLRCCDIGGFMAICFVAVHLFPLPQNRLNLLRRYGQRPGVIGVMMHSHFAPTVRSSPLMSCSTRWRQRKERWRHADVRPARRCSVPRASVSGDLHDKTNGSGMQAVECSKSTRRAHRNPPVFQSLRVFLRSLVSSGLSIPNC